MRQPQITIKCNRYVQSIIIIVGFTKMSRLNRFQQDLYSIGDRIICRQLLEKIKRGHIGSVMYG